MKPGNRQLEWCQILQVNAWEIRGSSNEPSFLRGFLIFFTVGKRHKHFS